jgi:predicted permease
MSTPRITLLPATCAPRSLHYLSEVPMMVADPFWLVCLILTATPTANNIVVMCDLAGENRRAMSAAIFYQYCAAPFILPGVLTLFISFICRAKEEE